MGLAAELSGWTGASATVCNKPSPGCRPPNCSIRRRMLYARTDAGSFLKYMESLRKYRENVITYFKDHKLFESTAYFTAQSLDEFPHRQK